MMGRECPQCGAMLDPNERCDCHPEARAEELERLRNRINIALLRLKRRGEDPVRLGDYTPYHSVNRVPDEVLPYVAQRMDNEVRRRRELGDEVYFSRITPAERAVALMEAANAALAELASKGRDVNAGMTEMEWNYWLEKQLEPQRVASNQTA